MNHAPIISACSFSYARSGGSGGQHVNKVSSKVILRFFLADCAAFTESEKQLIQERLQKKWQTDGSLIITCDQERSQIKNKQIALEKLIKLLSKALQPEVKRIATKASRSSHEKRLQNKSKHSAIKKNRKPPETE